MQCFEWLNNNPLPWRSRKWAFHHACPWYQLLSYDWTVAGVISLSRMAQRWPKNHPPGLELDCVVWTPATSCTRLPDGNPLQVTGSWGPYDNKSCTICMLGSSSIYLPRNTKTTQYVCPVLLLMPPACLVLPQYIQLGIQKRPSMYALSCF